MQTIDKTKVDEIIDELLGNDDLTASPEVWYGLHQIKNIQPVATDICVGDTISRQAARHALCKAVHKGEDIPCENQTASCLWTGTRVCDFVREIDALPPAQPERKEGHWIEGGIYRDVIECNCSECGQLMTTAATVRMNYCPRCGARMKEGEANG